MRNDDFSLVLDLLKVVLFWFQGLCTYFGDDMPNFKPHTNNSLKGLSNEVSVISEFSLRAFQKRQMSDPKPRGL